MLRMNSFLQPSYAYQFFCLFFHNVAFLQPSYAYHFFCLFFHSIVGGLHPSDVHARIASKKKVTVVCNIYVYISESLLQRIVY